MKETIHETQPKERKVDDTLKLTDALEKGLIGPEDYLRQRAFIVGRSNLYDNLILPLFRPKQD